MNKEEIIELQEQINEILAGSSAGEGESELIQALERKTLNLSINQIKALLFLKVLYPDNKYIKQFINDYLEFKKYNNAYSIILKGIELISLHNFIKGRLKFNINLSK